jgi:hypothetical protein
MAKGAFFRGTCLLLAGAMLISCSHGKSTGPAHEDGPDQPTNTLSLPYNENFEGSASVIAKNWCFYYAGVSWIPSACATPFELDSTDHASGQASMRAGEEEGNQWTGWEGNVFCGSDPWLGSLTLRKDIDLSKSTSCTISFLNKRDVVSKKALPPALQGEENDPQCHVDVSPDGGQTWTSVKSFSTDQREWVLEAISLNDFVGRKQVRISLRIPQHATSSHSTQWSIDDVAIVAH